MNVYVVVEGKATEPAVYKSWIPLVNPRLSNVDYLPQVTQNHFIIRSGGGWPCLLGIVENAMEDIKTTGKFDRLVVAVDSEEATLEDRFNHIEQHILKLAPPCPYRIIVQHFCFEAWALGNRKIVPKNPTNETLKQYKALHDVSTLDPELLPSHYEQELNRAQFALKYLRLAIGDKGKHLSYSKNNPQVVAHPTYFQQLKERMLGSSHISSLKMFIDAFI